MSKRPTPHQCVLPTLAILTTAAALLAGCESSDDGSGAYWTTKKEKHPAAVSDAGATPNAGDAAPSSSSATGAEEEIGGVDEVAFGSLHWNYGGVSGGGASKTTATIARLSTTADGMTYTWTSGGCENLGASSKSDYSKTVACLFVQRDNGQWVGGKFDMISTSRKSRSFVNIKDGYHGWSLAGVPNPCNCAFVIVSSDGKKRTNVISGTWKR